MGNLEQIKKQIHMKRFFLVLIGAMLLNGADAQLLQQGETALVYYAPKNYVVVDFEYTIDTYEAGPYARYAQSLLGIADAITETRTEYHLGKPHIITRTVADSRRAYKVLPEKDFPAQLLTIDNKGLLVGYNLPQEADAPKQKNKIQKEQAEQNELVESLPLTDEQLNVHSEEAKAKAIAKQIFRLRETRMYLLSGELDHTPADGKAMQLVLNELQQSEEKLLRLFVGRHKSVVEHERLEFLPTEESTTERRFLYFSPENGFTSSENIDAAPITISLTALRQQSRPVVGKQKGKAPLLSQIIYNLPGQAEIVVTYDGKTLGERTLSIAQYGIDVPLARELFTGKTLPVIRMDTRTGNIVSIQQ